MAEAFFRGPHGSDPVQHVIQLAQAIQPTVGDALYAGQILRSRIIERAARGIDVDGNTFVPYSEQYRKTKERKLGSADPVNLFGFEQHTHMLNTIVVKAGASEMGSYETVAPEITEPVNLFEIGFYGEEAVRAQAHNEGARVSTRLGTGKKPVRHGNQYAMAFGAKGKASAVLPVRHFFGANQEDLDLMAFAIGERAMLRAKAV